MIAKTANTKYNKKNTIAAAKAALSSAEDIVDPVLYIDNEFVESTKPPYIKLKLIYLFAL